LSNPAAYSCIDLIKINNGSLSFFASIVFSASIILETSPPEATLASGLGSSPGFVEMKIQPHRNRC